MASIGSISSSPTCRRGWGRLDLRYLAADYFKKTSKIDERGARRVLASASVAVSEMLSTFQFDSDDVA